MDFWRGGYSMNKHSGFGAVVHDFKKNWPLWLMALPAIVLVFILAYMPMSGLILAFKNYRYDLGIFGSPWCGMDNFEFLFMGGTGWQITKNTILYNVLNLFTSQFLSIFVAIVITEMTGVVYKKIVQSVIFLPYFISWVIVGTFVYNIFNTDYGIIKGICEMMGVPTVNVYRIEGAWPWIICFFNSWKWCGYNSVIYIAAITGIDSACYEAADIDGANIWQKIGHITFPSIRPTLITMILLQVGRILRGDFQMFYQIIGNNSNLYNATDVIDTYVFRSLTTSGNLGFSSAATFYQSVLCFVIIMLVNGIVRKIDADYALF